MKLVRFIDSIILFFLTLFSIFVAVVDLLDLFPNVALLHTIDFTVVGLVLLGFIGLHLVVVRLETRDQTRNLEEFPTTLGLKIDGIVARLQGIQVEVFENAEEQDRYLAKRIQAAKSEVCDLSWKDTLSPNFALKRRKRAHSSYETSIQKAADRITYREVFIFSDTRRLEKLERRAKEKKSGYSCSFFGSGLEIPRIQFVLIDGEEVVFASSAYPKLCSIRQAELGAIMQSYFEQVWNAADPIIESGVLQQETLNRIREQGVVSTESTG